VLLADLARTDGRRVIAGEIGAIVAQSAVSPTMVTPGAHTAMSVAMTNCGCRRLGHRSQRGYRYDGQRSRAREIRGRRCRHRSASLAARAAGRGPVSAVFTGRMPDQSLRAWGQDVPGIRTGTRPIFGAPIVSVRWGYPRSSCSADLKPQRQAAALQARAWRHRGVGRSGAAQLFTALPPLR